jgi:Flp pilus assembly protein TadD
LNTVTRWSIAASAFIALAAWPFVLHARMAETASADPIMQLAPAPAEQDYLTRDKSVAFLESRYKKDPADMITPARLSAEYLQRYRERGDIGDVLRAESAAHASLDVLPARVNAFGDSALASAELTLHKFRAAKAALLAARHAQGKGASTDIALASIDLELGEYGQARRLIEANAAQLDPPAAVTAARWYEISGRLAESDRLVDRAAHYADSIFDVPAERRAWYHFRLGELRFLGGDNAGAIAQEHQALELFPNDFLALGALARIELANKDYAQAQAAAARGVAIVPTPETLGILADTQAAQGDVSAAAASRAEIDAEEKIGNVQHVNDRLIAVYLADHGLRAADAYAIARRELLVRDDVYAEDTLAWCAAADGRWHEARAAAAKALRFDTEDPRLQYHAGVIAQHFGDAVEAVRRYTRALALNPHFSATQADDARAQLARLQAP